MRVLLASAPLLVAGHTNHVWPPNWMDAGGKVTVAPFGSCSAGCEGKKKGCDSFCMWYTNWTMLPSGVEPTMLADSPFRTYFDTWTGNNTDYWLGHPWSHPGKAPVWSSCGISGGNPRNDGQGSDGGWVGGPDARYFVFDDIVTTNWKQGQVVEVAWGITANHGGGYTFRLCPAKTATQPDGLPQDEGCFQDRILKFHGGKQWLQIGNDRSTRNMWGDLEAMDLSDGTWPVDSTWRRNPIPACQGGGSAWPCGRGGGNQTDFPNKGPISCSRESYKDADGNECPGYGFFDGPQFDPPGGYPGPYADQGIYTYGFGNNEGLGGGPFAFSIVDLLEIPEDIEPGTYVLSYRNDCDQTTQVWSSCSTVEILPKDTQQPTQHLIPDGPAGIDLSFLESKKAVV